MKKAKQVNVKFNNKTKKYETDLKAPKGKRVFGVDQNGKVLIYDDKGNVVAAQG